MASVPSNPNSETCDSPDESFSFLAVGIDETFWDANDATVLTCIGGPNDA